MNPQVTNKSWFITPSGIDVLEKWVNKGRSDPYVQILRHLQTGQDDTTYGMASLLSYSPYDLDNWLYGLRHRGYIDAGAASSRTATASNEPIQQEILELGFGEYEVT